jgi:hypothetical protein
MCRPFPAMHELPIFGRTHVIIYIWMDGKQVGIPTLPRKSDLCSQNVKHNIPISFSLTRLF